MSKKNKKTQETAKRSRKLTNEILEDHGDWLLLDISTDKYPDATMAVDTDVWNLHDGGRVHATMRLAGSKYIYAAYNKCCRSLLFHSDVIDCAKGHEADHIQHGTMSFIDNRRSNLRSSTHSQNQMNRSTYINNSTGIPGVAFHKISGKWQVRIQIDCKQIYLGYFDNIEIAIGVRQQAEREFYGEFAYKGGSK
jgi:hypothetical protein